MDRELAVVLQAVTPMLPVDTPHMTLRAEPFADDLPERPRVLLVDDDEVNLLLTSIALRERGFSVTEATERRGGDPRRWPTGCPTSSCSTR